jgi:hypothetical protein
MIFFQGFHDIKVSINSTVMSQILTQIISSYHDFYGFLLGNYKIIVDSDKFKTIKMDHCLKVNKVIEFDKLEEEENDSIIKEKKIINNQLLIKIESVYLIFDDLRKDHLPDTINLIKNSNPGKEIIGFSSGKSFSQSIISLKEQSLYLDIQKLLNDNINYDVEFQLKNEKNFYFPLLFGAFSHSKDTNKSISFYSKFFIYEHENQEFKDLPYEIINLQKINYNCAIEPLLNKCVRTVTFSSLKIYENEVKSLKKLIGNSINDIQTMKLSLIQKYKKLINNELENYDILVMRKKMMKEGSNK